MVDRIIVRIWDFVILRVKGDFVGGIKIRILRRERILDDVGVLCYYKVFYEKE